MKKRRRYRYRGYLPQVEFEAFCLIIVEGSPVAVHTAGKVILRWLAQEKKELLKQAEMIAELVARYGAAESP